MRLCTLCICTHTNIYTIFCDNCLNSQFWEAMLFVLVLSSNLNVYPCDSVISHWLNKSFCQHAVKSLEKNISYHTMSIKWNTKLYVSATQIACWCLHDKWANREVHPCKVKGQSFLCVNIMSWLSFGKLLISFPSCFNQYWQSFYYRITQAGLC